jgi:hypothetical protein
MDQFNIFAPVLRLISPVFLWLLNIFMSGDNRFYPIDGIVNGKGLFFIVRQFLGQVEFVLMFFVKISNKFDFRIFFPVLFDLLTDISPLLALNVVELNVKPLAKRLLLFQMPNL